MFPPYPLNSHRTLIRRDPTQRHHQKHLLGKVYRHVGQRYLCQRLRVAHHKLHRPRLMRMRARGLSQDGKLLPILRGFHALHAPLMTARYREQQSAESAPQ